MRVQGPAGSILAFTGILMLGSCGYVGDPLPPARNIVLPVKDLRAVEIGDRIEIDFTLPGETTEGLEWTKIAGVEMRVGPSPQPFEVNAWSNGAKVVEIATASPGKIQQGIDAKDWVGREVVIGVRARNAKGRLSPWSNFVAVSVVEPLAAPAQVRAEGTARGVSLAWASPANKFQVFRKGPKDAAAVLLGESDAGRYLDEGVEFNQAYEYTVLAMNGPARSLASASVTIVPVDKFPPGIPRGLRAITGVARIELAWDPNSDSDLRGYNLYRTAAGGEFVRVAELIQLPSFSDRNTDPGKRYGYAVSAVDGSGNESGRSSVVEIESPR